MRIAFVSFEYPPFIIGGAGIYAKNLAKELAALGHQVTVFTPGIGGLTKTKNELAENLRVIRAPVIDRLPFKAFQFWLRLPKILRRAESEDSFDVVHVNGISYWFLKKRLLDVPHVLTVHHLAVDAGRANSVSFLKRLSNIGGENGLLIPRVERKAVRNVISIIAVSEFTRRRLIEEYRLIPDRIITIHNGVEPIPSSFPERELDHMREQWNSGRRQVVLFVGRVNDPRKGLELLLRAFSRVLKEVDCTLLVVGSGDQTKMRNLAKNLGIQDDVGFVGWADELDLRKYYTLCNVYVCPSRLEGFGLTVLEAMIAGKPVVATDVGALPELIEDRVNGIIVKKEDIEGMAHSIIKLLKDDKLAHEMGSVGRRLAYERFSWSSCAKEVEGVFAELIRENPA